MSQIEPLPEEKSITIYDMMDEILVVCPGCQSCARITPTKNANTFCLSYFQPQRLVCQDCGLVKDWNGKGLGFNWYADPMCDSYFRLPLWLQISCRHHVLWAYNERHLLLLEKYIQAKLRQSKRVAPYGWHNQSLFSRLPKWMVIAKNRSSVLSAIAKLKRKSQKIG
ncbi:hypothetical protein [Nostoc sp. UHCC 0870]|uniref:hypothetical protein n=1 Tax=Nostoc sp. UHCC 0870 TaxID=2914041 RepID=UPI001EDF5E0C|nr:hypothetical protein [Nostoc sp. UHCC 0870]UKP01300.1 hypothetical protein L6494_29265 [Nostoc sp. UHCC 0870]